MYKRLQYRNIFNSLFKQKVIILYGPRQVGKTTLVKKLQADFNGQSIYYSADRPNIKELFKYENIDKNLSKIIQNKLVILDEAQNIENIGKVLKIIHDTNPEIQLVVTGSSAFDLNNKLAEPLTGRSLIFKLYPLSIVEIESNDKPLNIKDSLDRLLVFGSYPEVYLPQNISSIQALENISSNYLYKDIFTLSELQKPELLEKILVALALQVGSEVSFQELANTTQSTVTTIERYINILEKAFIIFRLPSLSRNMRNEISKTRKIYFWDLGIRNYLINNLNELNLRDDVGKLWENFLIIERIKQLEYLGIRKNQYFWRNYAQAEVDYIEESKGKLDIFEFKWSIKKTPKLPKAIAENYVVNTFNIVNPDNFTSFLDLP